MSILLGALCASTVIALIAGTEFTDEPADGETFIRIEDGRWCE